MKKLQFFQYGLCSSVVFDEEGKEHTTYGITVKDSTGTVLRRVKDISLDRKEVSELIGQCNRLHLEPVHLDDVIDDFLCK